jgi:SPP1 family predicted phage head-tail adaptor
MLQAGQLNKCVTLQSKTKTADDMGGYDVTWENEVTDTWAAIWPVSASDFVRTSQEAIVVTHRIRIRYRSGVKSDWRIKYKSRYFDIVSIINPNESDEMLELMCKEVMS